MEAGDKKWRPNSGQWVLCCLTKQTKPSACKRKNNGDQQLLPMAGSDFLIRQ